MLLKMHGGIGQLVYNSSVNITELSEQRFTPSDMQTKTFIK